MQQNQISTNNKIETERSPIAAFCFCIDDEVFFSFINVFDCSNGSNYLLKILLNEKEVALPITTTIFSCCNWNNVKSY
jgi:hypothetical protein